MKKPTHWRARASDYEHLAKEARDPELRQVLDHLARVCHDVANAREAREPKAPVWITVDNIPREATAQRWRIRAAEYHAMADNSISAEGVKAWRTLAGRCAELAAYLEATVVPISRPGQRAS